VAVVVLAGVTLLAPSGAPPPAPSAAVAAPPVGFAETTVISGLTNPTVVRFAQDGRIFVAEKSGLIKVFDNLSDTTPTTFADLRTNVHNFWDRGLLGMALDPNFPATPYVYVAYTYDHVLGDQAPAPRWGTPGVSSDPCPNPPGATSDGCVVSGRLSRLQANGNVMTGPEQVLVEDWCQQYPSHSVGAVEFGPDGALYVSAGDGASFTFADYGQDGNPLNPCGDPPGGVGAVLTPPTAEGGALRTQDLRTTGDPVSLDGTVIRVNSGTGAAHPTNPLIGSSDANARRIIAYGLRNPFRFAFRPGSSEIWVGDVGWNEWEEINTIDNPSDAVVENFGWPCYEGNPVQPGYDAIGLSICENLQPNDVTKPFHKYHHTENVVAGESCPVGSSSISGIAFEFAPTGGTFPTEYQGALFFSDYSRDCIWAMRKGGNLKPNPGHLETFVSAAANPVNIEFGPEGNLYYVDFDGGMIRRVAPTSAPPPGGSTFGQPSHYGTGTNAHGVALGQLNGDGRLDLAVANAGSNSITVRLGNGDGTFGAATNFATGTTPKSVAIADLSGDGNVDLVTADQSSNTVSVLLGNGTGGFGARTGYPVCTGTHEVAVGSFNGDGRPDLAAACWGGSTINVLLGTGNGAFGTAIVSTAGAAPHSLVARDFDRDGRTDLAVANHDAASVSVLRGNGNGTFVAPVNYTVGAGPHSIRLADLDNDGNGDLVTANDGANNVSVLLGNSNGTFDAASNHATGLVPKGVGTGDFNRDGKWDVITANTAGNYPTGANNPGGDQISVLFGNGAGGLGAPTNYLVGNTPFSVAVGQINSDSQPDVVTANWFSNNASVLLNGTNPPPSGGTIYVSDLNWTSMTNGWGPVERDRSNGEAAAGDGTTITLDGTTYAKGLGTHSVSDVRYALPAGCTRFKAAVGVDDEVGSLGSVVFQVFAGATQVYASPTLTGTSATVQVDVSIAGASELRLVVGNGNGSINFDHGDWADARIECGADTTPPTITARTPTPGATGVAVSVSPTATFSEAMNPATLTTTTFTLVQQGQSTPLPAAVTYASQVATLNPNANLQPNTTYTATVKGGSSGAKDLAGNPLAADVSWSFTTAAGTNQPPTPVIDTPAAGLTWKVGDNIAFTGHATDPEQGTLPASALTWRLLVQHCPSNCHSHTIQTWPGVASGSFAAPDHEYPSYLDLELTATDAGGASQTVVRRLDPQTVVLTFASNPSGLQLSVNAASQATPFTRTVIVGSSNSITAPSPQTSGGSTYAFSSWSDGGAQTHNITAPASAATYTATFTPSGGGGTTYISDMTFTQATNGWGPVERDRSNGEAAAGDGTTLRLNGVTYAKGVGTHALSDVRVNLPAGCTRFKAAIGVDDEVGSSGSVVFQVFAGATQIYASPTLTGTSATVQVDVSIAGASELRLVVGNGNGSIAYDHADWADARIECGGGGGDTTPPTITAQTPASGATGVAVSVSPTATFSEAMNPATLTTTTFTLVQQGQSTPLPAAVTYASQVATLNPNADLLPNTTYTATVKGGSAGAKDLAGNALAADVTWSFTTAAGGGPTTTYISDMTFTQATNGWGPVERDRSNGEAAAGDGTTLRLNGVTYAKGVGTHALSDVRVNLPAGCTRFKAAIGVDDEVGSSGSVVFQVFAGATQIYASPTLTGTSATVQVDVSIAGASELRLVVGNGGNNINYDHADWADARIECG
jgi:glucose/arabinose dehydrogenase